MLRCDTLPCGGHVRGMTMIRSDDELDALLRAADPEPAPDHAAAAYIASLTRRVSTDRRRSRLPVVLGIVAGSIALTAATTVASSYLDLPPHVGLEGDDLRTNESVPLRYTTDEGAEVACRTWFDLRNADGALADELDEAIREHDWSSWGQDLYDSLPGLPPQPSDILNPPDELNDAMVASLMDFVASAVPELTGGEAGPHVSALSTTCLPEDQ